MSTSQPTAATSNHADKVADMVNGTLSAFEESRLDCFQKWNLLFDQGKQHVRNAEWEEALRALRKAERLCFPDEDSGPESFKHDPFYKWTVQGEIGHIYRMLGRNKDAVDILDTAIKEMPKSLQRIELMGELSVVYRHMNWLEASKDCSAGAYETAKQLLAEEEVKGPALRLKLEKEMCRAIGDWGMVSYQIFMDTRKEELLQLAVEQLTERITIAQRIKASPDLQLLGEKERDELVEYCSQREAISLARLSLCYQESGQLEKSIDSALGSLKIQGSLQTDPTKIAFSRYFYGRALLRAGRKEEAKREFNPPGTCTPTIALCKEPSDEHRAYIREMIEAGADMELRDEQGYSALECAVYCGDTATQLVVEEGLKKKFMQEAREHEAKQQIVLPGQKIMSFNSAMDPDKRVERLRYEAFVRTGYRQLFQDTLRPVLLAAQSPSDLDHLRSEYASALQEINKDALMFDSLRVVYYSDFVKAGRIPKSGDGFTQEVGSSKGGEFIIFFSYRWIGKGEAGYSGASPDDPEHTQYRRMVRALEEFLEKHRHIESGKLCVWVDYACVEQHNPTLKRAGVISLPLSLAQCSAMISLIDDNYNERSWCCIEVMMIQTLRKSYRFHMWFEDVLNRETGGRYLREGPIDQEINMAEKKVTYETDRPTLMFLERQTRLLE